MMNFKSMSLVVYWREFPKDLILEKWHIMLAFLVASHAHAGLVDQEYSIAS